MKKRFFVVATLSILAVLAVPLGIAAGALKLGPIEYDRLGNPPSPFELADTEQKDWRVSIENWLANRLNLEIRRGEDVALRSFIHLRPGGNQDGPATGQFFKAAWTSIIRPSPFVSPKSEDSYTRLLKLA